MLERVFLILFWGIAMGICSMAAWGGWAEMIYDRHGNRDALQACLEILDLSPEREHGVRLVKWLGMAGIVIVTFCVASGLLAVE